MQFVHDPLAFSETETDPARGKAPSSQHPSALPPPVLQGQRHTPLPPWEKLCRGVTSPLRLLPDFLIIGAQKGGTTSLYTYLQALPGIAPAARKEVHFFDRRANLNRGLTWYRGHFPTAVQKQWAQHVRSRPLLTGEATPEYVFLPHIPPLVARVLPHARLIVLLRNPVDRAYSQYQHAVVQGHETRSFEEAITCQQARLAEDQAMISHDKNFERYTSMQHCYLLRSIYLDQLQRWMAAFPREHFLILRSEDFFRDPAATLSQVADFLNIATPASGLGETSFKAYYTNRYQKLDEALRRRLLAFFEPHNARLSEFLGVDFNWNA